MKWLQKIPWRRVGKFVGEDIGHTLIVVIIGGIALVIIFTKCVPDSLK